MHPPVTPPSAPSCTPNWDCSAWSNPENSCGTRTCTDLNSCGTSSGKPAESLACPVPGANANPLISSFILPSTANADSTVTATVTATDANGNLGSIQIFAADGTTAVSASQSCAGLASCTKSFILQIPNAFSAVYTFIARVFDAAGATDDATAFGTTNPEAVVPPPAPAPEPDEVLDDVDVSVPTSQSLFISSAVPGSGCIAPGESTFMYTSLRNRGDRTLKDVKITAVIYDLNVRAASGPFSLRSGGSTSRYMQFEIPSDAENGEYYVRVEATAGKDSVVKHRLFEVNSAC